MKRHLLILLTAFVVAYAPWRLLALAGEVFIVAPSHVRVSQGNDRYWDTIDLMHRMEDLGWEVTFEPNLNSHGHEAYGATTFGLHTVQVNEKLSWNARLAVLAHEGGHTLEPRWMNSTQREVFAESVATLVSHDGLREHARYLARTRSESITMLLTEWQQIYHAAATLEEK